MIAYLTIKNIALIQELSLELKDGLNILSGETGAGKSIIIDSINFVLGDRADRSLIRHGETYAQVEVVFRDLKNHQEIKQILDDAGIDADDDVVIVSRSMTLDRSECRINRKIVTLSLLRSIVSLLVDTHTQNEHQSLLKISNHQKLLDAFNPKIEKKLQEYRKIYQEYNNVLAALKEYYSQAERERQIDILKYQISEIEKANLTEGEESELKTKRSLFYNAQKIYGSLHSACESLSGYAGSGGIEGVKQALNSLQSIAQYDESVNELIERLDSCYIELKDVYETLLDKNNAEDISSLNIDALEKRLEEIRLIKKKYGKTYEEINAFYEKATKDLDNIINSENRINSLTQQKEDLLQKLCVAATNLHEIRMKTANDFCKVITKNLCELGMKNSVFKVNSDFDSAKITEKLTNNGAETLEFMLSPNVGEPLKPLAKIASGGEMSRFMLALKNIVAELDNVDTLIFDEIDTGISGVIAKVVAEKLYDIARNRQVIAITHLPQLASMGDTNFLIEKKVIGEKTLTFVKELNENEIFREIMRLSGAVENSNIGLSNAKELKKQANDYKNK